MNFINQIRKDFAVLRKVIPEENAKIESFLSNRSVEKLINFLIVAEDHRYKYHIGFDLIAIIRAGFKHLVYNKHEGASTIEQQLVRVITNDYRYNIYRKIKEIFLAVYVKFMLDKRNIAMIYLNIAYYGTKYQSLDAILRKYNLTKSDTLTDRICAEVVARLKYPEPLICSAYRERQINIRVRHILNLYKKFSKSKIFLYEYK